MQTAGPHEGWRSGFSLVTGGPFYQLLLRTRLVRPGDAACVQPALAVSTLALAPLLLGAAVDAAATGRVDPLLTDASVYTRFLVAIPLFFAGEYALHVRCTRTVERFVQGDFAGDEAIGSIERALRRCEYLRDLRGVEIVLAVVAVLGGQAALWQWTGFSGWLRSLVGPLGFGFARLWYSAVALPLFQFLLVRWLWRWLIWSYWLLRVARLRLRLLPTHPDHAGGLVLLADPIYAFAFFAAGMSSVIAGAWATRLFAHDTQVPALVLPAALFALIVAGMAFTPLLAFSLTMVRERFRAVRQYAELANVHMRLFHRRWIEAGPDDAILGAPDVSSLCDLQSAYQDMVQMRPVPIGLLHAVAVAGAVLVPMLPLVTFEIPLPQLLLKLGQSLLG